MPVQKPFVALVLVSLAGFGVGVAFATSDDAPRPRVVAPPKSTPDGDDEGGERAHARYYGPECGAQIAGGTHGDYVSRTAHEDGDVPAMAQSNCGKPLTSVDGTPPVPENQEGGGDDHPLGGPPGQNKGKGKSAKR